MYIFEVFFTAHYKIQILATLVEDNLSPFDWKSVFCAHAQSISHDK